MGKVIYICIIEEQAVVITAIEEPICLICGDAQ